MTLCRSEDQCPLSSSEVCPDWRGESEVGTPVSVVHCVLRRVRNISSLHGSGGGGTVPRPPLHHPPTAATTQTISNLQGFRGEVKTFSSKLPTPTTTHT